MFYMYNDTERFIEQYTVTNLIGLNDHSWYTDLVMAKILYCIS